MSCSLRCLFRYISYTIRTCRNFYHRPSSCRQDISKTSTTSCRSTWNRCYQTWMIMCFSFYHDIFFVRSFDDSPVITVSNNYFTWMSFIGIFNKAKHRFFIRFSIYDNTSIKDIMPTIPDLNQILFLHDEKTKVVQVYRFLPS